jgi:hypothetical protein
MEVEPKGENKKKQKIPETVQRIISQEFTKEND